jgi:endoglucanase
VLLAVLFAAHPAVAAPVGTRICERFGNAAVADGRYVVQTNVWGATTRQCLDLTGTGFAVTTARHHKTGAAPAAYPSIYAGCHYGTCSSGSGLPMAAASPGFAAIDTGVALSYPDSGEWNAAYDIWFDPTPRTTGQNTGAELMVWLGSAGSPRPSGSMVGTATLAGGTWTVWVGHSGSTVVSYVRTTPTASITFGVHEFYADLVSRGYARPSWYLTSVQVGFETWEGGAGLALDSFSFGTDGSAGREVAGPGSGRCLDLRGYGSADGTPVQLWDCGRTWNQMWTYTGGRLVNPRSGGCLDVAGGGIGNGTPVRLWPCGEVGAQQWQVHPNGTVTNPRSGRCLDAVGRATGNGTRLQIWDCADGGSANQVWSLR